MFRNAKLATLCDWSCYGYSQRRNQAQSFGINWHVIGICAVRLSAKKWQYVKLLILSTTEDFRYELVKRKTAKWWSRGESNTETRRIELVKRYAIGIILA